LPENEAIILKKMISGYENKIENGWLFCTFFVNCPKDYLTEIFSGIN
jgi:hypothetical protein